MAARPSPVRAGRKAAASRPSAAAVRARQATRPSGPVGIGLIGQRFMGRAHSNAWSQVNRFFEPERPARQRLLAARDTVALAEFAPRWGWEEWTADWRALVTDPQVELVDIGTPNHHHRPAALAAFAAGKHVACEKPLASTLDDARAMRDAAAAAARRGLHSFVWFNYRRCPAVGLAHELVREGRLGPIRHVRARYLQSWATPEVPHGWRFRRSQAGSGAHGDLNAHAVDLARFLVGEPIEVVHGAAARTFVKERAVPASTSAAARRRKPARARVDVDDALAFLAGFRGGALASFEATRLAPGHHNDLGLELNGERGSLRFDFEDMNVLWLHEPGRDGRRSEGWTRILATAPGHPWVGRFWPEGHVLGYEHGFIHMAADMLTVLAGGRPVVPLPDFADAFETQRVLEAAAVAVRERRSVPLSELR